MRNGYKAITVAMLCSISTAALAQATADTAAPAPAAPPTDTNAVAEGGLEDIVVTATRREERLQDIPVTVTAITSDTVRGAGIREVRELTQVVPAFTGGRSASVMQPVIRGVGSSGVSVGDESNIATYIDGVYQADPFSTSIDLVEVERVEVLRGPQGTVFGRNATGGLINIITPDPSFDTRGRISARYGRLRNDASDYDARAYITGGLTETLAADFAGLYRKTDAYIDDLFRGGHVGEVQVVDVRSKLLFRPSDTAKIVLSVQYGDQESSVNAFQPYDNIQTSGRRFPGVILTTGPWQYAGNIVPQSDYERLNVALRTQFDLGGASLETTSGYMRSETDQVSDGDSSNFLLSQLPFNTVVKTYSQEVRLLSNSGGRFTWLLGAYAFHLKGFMDVLLQNSAGPGRPLVETALYPEIKTTSFAGFAEGTYEIVDDIFVTAGARYTDEERKFRQRVNGAQLPFGPNGTAERKFNKWTYRGAIRYHFADDANFFISYGTGFKSGVFNAVGTSPLSTDPETIKALEAGVKIDPTPWLRTNLSIYKYDYKDLQVNARNAAGTSYILQNAANAKIYGGELEVTVSPSNDLNVRGSIAYIHGEYEDFPQAQTFVPRADGGNDVVAQDVSGKRVVRAPRTTFNLGFDWSHDLAGGRLSLVGNLFHSGKVYHDFLNIYHQESYTLASGEISWTTPDEHWRFTLFAKNITNEAVAQQIKPGAPSTDVFFEPPRRIGIGAELRF